jgi:phage tail sheath protein FI
VVVAFMDGLFRQGALMGQTPEQAYSVQCGLGTTMTADDILNGIVRIEVLLAPLQPSEFVIITMQQQTGPAQT